MSQPVASAVLANMAPDRKMAKTDKDRATTRTTADSDLIDRVAIALCESYGNEWDESLDDSRGAPSNHPGLPGKDDWRDMAKDAIAVIRQWDAGK